MLPPILQEFHKTLQAEAIRIPVGQPLKINTAQTLFFYELQKKSMERYHELVKKNELPAPTRKSD